MVDQEARSGTAKALLVLLAAEPMKPAPEFKYMAEGLSLISKDPSHQFNVDKGLWYTSAGKKILPQKQAEAMIKQMHQSTHLGVSKLIQAF